MKLSPRLLVVCLLVSSIASATPSIALSKKSGPPTSQILVSGRGFEPNVGVDVYFDTKDEVLVVTDSKGEFKDAKAYAPRSARPGQHWVTALERNNDKGAQKPFLVQTNWSQYRFSPEHDGENPYENVLNPQTVASLDLRWTYNAIWGAYSSPIVVGGVAFVTTWDALYALDAKTGTLRWKVNPPQYDLFSADPAVADGMLYIGTYDEGIYALNAKTGATLWHYPSGFARVQSPLLVADGVVYFGDQDENYASVYALNARSGKLLWKHELGGEISINSPTVADGILYMTSDDRNLYALSAQTGSKLWTFETGSTMSSTPSVAYGTVYFGSDDSNVYALNAATGSLLWSYHTSGAVAYSSAVANGIVYVSSTDGNLYALNAYSGKFLWSYATGGSFRSNPTVANGVLYVGSQYPDGVYALSATSGTLLWSYATSSFVVSDPAVVNGMVYIDSYDDGNIYAFALTDTGAMEGQLASTCPALETLRPDLSLKASNYAAAVAPH